MRAIPPGEGQHHNIIFELGALRVYLMLGEKHIPVALFNDDLDRSAEDIADEIIGLYNNEWRKEIEGCNA